MQAIKTTWFSPLARISENDRVGFIKWTAILCMTLDHIDAVFFARRFGWFTEIGRLTMPLFAAVLAYNLARPECLQRGVHERVLQRLVIFGLLAYPWHVMALGQGWASLNIMFSFGLGVVAIWAVDRQPPGWPLVILLVALLSSFVEFRAAGPMILLGFWMLFREQRSALVFLPLGFGVLTVQNGNVWALLALPLILLLALPQQATQEPHRASRASQWFFYGYYPAHLALLVCLARLNY